MRLTGGDAWEPAPGQVLSWQVKADGAGTPAPLSLNQRNHLGAAAAGGPSVWLAATFDVDGPIEQVALGRALHDFVARHGSLQLEAVLEPGGPVARRHHPGTLRWTTVTGAVTTSVTQTRDVLRSLLTDGCHPFGYPAFAPLAVSRADRSTIVLGMDHLHCDAYSVAIAVDELAALYDGHRLGAPAALPDPGCFVALVEADQRAPVRVWPDDERVGEWHRFLRERDFRLPTFPFPLGVEPGETAPQATLVRRLLDGPGIGALSARARSAGVSSYAASLVALAAAMRDLGGPERLDTLAPVGTRTDEASRRAVGWYTTTVPLSIPSDVTDAGLAEAGEAVRRAVAVAEVPLDEVMASLPAPLVRDRSDVFMVSWLDYRHLPGAALARTRNAQHISAPTRADDVQLWLARTDDGLDLRVRLPDTDIAREVLGAVVAAWTLLLRGIGSAERTLPG